MRPRHCKEVAFKRVDFPLTGEEICRRLTGERLFTRTDYLILENGAGHAVARVIKKRGLELFREVVGVEVLALPDSTVFVRDSGCDVLNPHAMALKAVEHPEDTVIVQGAFEHISFIKGEKAPKVLKVVDFIPPSPSKTLEMVKGVLRLGVVETPLLIELVLVDAVARVSARKSAAGTVMFPCEAGHIVVGGRQVLYLDKAPPLRENEEVLLAGCPLSRKIFHKTYHREPEFVDLCPRDLALENRKPGELYIARCCDIHKVKVENGLALVPYGATMMDMADAIKELLRQA